MYRTATAFRAAFAGATFHATTVLLGSRHCRDRRWTTRNGRCRGCRGASDENRPESESGAETTRFATFNIRDLTGEQVQTTGDDQAAVAARVIREPRPDVLVLNEIVDNFQGANPRRSTTGSRSITCCRRRISMAKSRTWSGRPPRKRGMGCWRTSKPRRITASYGPV